MKNTHKAIRKGIHNTYWGNVREGIRSLLGGLRLSFRHLLDARHSHKNTGIDASDYFSQSSGIVTLQYPQETFPVPDIGRYKLHNEIDDCIVCDKCAKICPVDCIEIEPVRAVEEIGKTSDGSSKRIYPARFDIDMSKCCFCGLCTTVCPTECLTMTKEYDFSEFDVKDHTFSFSEMTPLEILEKKKELQQFMEEKEKAKAAAKKTGGGASAAKPKVAARPKTAHKPKMPAGRPRTQDKPQPSSDPQEAARRIMEEKKKNKDSKDNQE